MPPGPDFSFLAAMQKYSEPTVVFTTKLNGQHYRSNFFSFVHHFVQFYYNRGGSLPRKKVLPASIAIWDAFHAENAGSSFDHWLWVQWTDPTTPPPTNTSVEYYSQEGNKKSGGYDSYQYTRLNTDEVLLRLKNFCTASKPKNEGPNPKQRKRSSSTELNHLQNAAEKALVWAEPLYLQPPPSAFPARFAQVPAVLEELDLGLKAQKSRVQCAANSAHLVWAVRIASGRVQVFPNKPGFFTLFGAMADSGSCPTLAQFRERHEGRLRRNELAAKDCMDLLEEYTKYQARQDPHLKLRCTFGRRTDVLVFENFAFLVTFDQCGAQITHIDMCLPLFQGALAISDDVPLTQAWTPAQEVQTMEDLDLRDMPAEVVNLLRTDSVFQSELEANGNLLAQRYHVTAPASMKRGSVTTLAGSMPHGGPAADGFRCLLFYNIRGPTMESYNTDIQQNRAGIWAMAFSRHFFKLGIAGRKALLKPVLKAALQHHNFSQNLQSDARLFFANLEDTLWEAHGKLRCPADIEAQNTIIEAFCVGEQTYPNGYYYEQLEDGQERTLQAISCLPSLTSDPAGREFDFTEVPHIWERNFPAAHP